MISATEYDGDDCVVLPANYLSSVDAAVELYEDDLAEAAANLDVDGLKRSFAQFVVNRGFAASLLWLLPAAWAVCI